MSTPEKLFKVPEWVKVTQQDTPSCINPDCCDGWLYVDSGARKCPDCANTRALKTLGLKTWADLDITHESWRAVRAYADDPKAWVKLGVVLVLMGDKGRGKTQAAYLLRQDVQRAGFSAAVVKWPEWFADYMDSWKTGGSNDMVKAVQQAEFLVIDELMPILEKPEQERRVLQRIVDYRYERGFSTCFTGNLTPDEFKDILGERAYSRVHACMDVIPFTGPDMRASVERAAVRDVIRSIRSKAR